MGLLEVLIVVLLIMWLLGVGFGTAGSLIHVLLIVVVVLVIVRLVQGRSVL